MIEPKVIIPPFKEPVTLAEVRAQCRLDISYTAEDAALGLFIAAAREYVEWRTARTIHDTTLEYVMDTWPGENYIELPRATPLIEIESVYYKNSLGVDALWAPSLHIADTDSMPGRLVLGYGEPWPSFSPYPVSPIRLRYRAGIDSNSPEVEATDAVKYPMLLLVAAMYENREGENVSSVGFISKASIDYGIEPFIQRLVVEHVC